MAFRLSYPLHRSFLSPVHNNKSIRVCKFSAQNQILDPIQSQKGFRVILAFPDDATSREYDLVFKQSRASPPPSWLYNLENLKKHVHKMVMEVKEKLERDHHSLPLGRNGRDDEGMILWYLKDRKFDVEAAATKLTKAIKWREEFGVSELSEESVESIAETGKAYVHDFLDVNDRPVLVVVGSKHFPAKQDPVENEKLCVFLIEKALSRLPAGQDEILGIFDLRGFSTENADLEFLKFLVDVFYYYYPKRLGQVLFVDSPLVFMTLWQLIRPLLKSYASVVRFCSADTVREEYFTETTVPADFRG